MACSPLEMACRRRTGDDVCFQTTKASQPPSVERACEHWISGVDNSGVDSAWYGTPHSAQCCAKRRWPVSHAAYICPAFLHMEREVSRRLPSQAAVTPTPSPGRGGGDGWAGCLWARERCAMNVSALRLFHNIEGKLKCVVTSKKKIRSAVSTGAATVPPGSPAL